MTLSLCEALEVLIAHSPRTLTSQRLLLQALGNLRVLRIAGLFVSAVAAAAALASAVFTRSAGVPVGAAPLWLVAVAVACAGAAYAAQELASRLIYHPWDHTLRP